MFVASHPASSSTEPPKPLVTLATCDMGETEMHKCNGQAESIFTRNGMNGVIDLFNRVFMPVGYPASVTKNYSNYVKFSVCQVFVQKISQLLATQAMLIAVGIGKGAALPMAAVVNWILKDGIGQFGSVIFGAIVNRNFDCDAKRFRVYAVALGQVANLFSIVTLSYPAL